MWMRRAADRDERGVNGGMKKWVAEERAVEELLQKSDEVTYPLKRYRTQRVAVKRAVKSCKKNGGE